jgi:hypothetical protein
VSDPKLEIKAGDDPLNTWNAPPPTSPPNPKHTTRMFPYTQAHRWKNKEAGTEFKVLPWFQPMAEYSRMDFRGLLKDLLPEMSDDVLAEFNCYSGLVVHAGWQLHNDAGVWFCVQHGIEEHFEDLGVWKDEDGEAKISIPLTKESMAKAEEKK